MNNLVVSSSSSSIDPSRIRSGHLNRVSSRSLDLLNASPSIDLHTYRSNANDPLKYLPVPTCHSNKYRYYPKTSNISSVSSLDYQQTRGIRRQTPLQRESSRRILVRPVVHRHRDASSYETFDRRPTEISFVEDVIDDDDVVEEDIQEEPENIYEMRIPIGRNYDTSDISVQLEGSKVLIHCYTIEPTDRRGNYRKHEYKCAVMVPETVDDDTIVAYLSEQGELIVEGKYHRWASNRTKTELEQSSHSDLVDGKYVWSNDYPPLLFYYLRLPFQTDLDAIRIQSDPQLHLLKVFIDQQGDDIHSKKNRSTSRLCHLPCGYHYDYRRVRVKFLKENFIRIELPTVH